jgi:hypothetical protein
MEAVREIYWGGFDKMGHPVLVRHGRAGGNADKRYEGKNLMSRNRGGWAKQVWRVCRHDPTSFPVEMQVHDTRS